MIRVCNISKTFLRNIDKNASEKKGFARKTKEEFYAVNNVSFEAKNGEILGILGPNGAGKTTLLRMLASLMTPNEGSVEIYDSNGTIMEKAVDKKKHIGYLSGNTKLYNRFSTREMLRILADVYGISDEDAEKRIGFIEDVLEMHSFMDNRIEKLSTGQTQRANIARCLIHTPDIYIFDEPTLGLDVISSDAIVNFMKKEKESGKTVLYSTHYMEEAQYLCDNIFMIYKGKQIAYGTPEELMESTGTANLRDTFKKLIGMEAGSDEL
ncbi:MAG: ABC transporter ATP-binding protein [Lachnospiraceae bacterium]|nr:ABC transporter ATP-binding protein [Lachnospiraceae bacterium]